MKDKYIEERFPTYFIFGEHVDGRVDVASAVDDTVVTTSKEHAEKLIQQHNDLVQCLCRVAQALDAAAPEVFKELWYGP